MSPTANPTMSPTESSTNNELEVDFIEGSRAGLIDGFTFECMNVRWALGASRGGVLI